MQDQLESLHRFATGKLLRIKEKKSNVMKFNFSKSYDFPPELAISGFKQQLEVTNETRLLGVIITSDLKWNANTDFICKKAYKKMWSVRRMKLLDLEPLLMLDFYAKEIRSVVELAVPAWHSGLTVKQSKDIERVQRVAVSIILSDCNTGVCDMTYDMALVTLDIEPLYVRRDKLCLTFAKKTVKSRHADIFPKNGSEHFTRSKEYYFENKSNTTRCYKSPVNYLTRLLNGKDN
jgi:hypothetical protein